GGAPRRGGARGGRVAGGAAGGGRPGLGGRPPVAGAEGAGAAAPADDVGEADLDVAGAERGRQRGGVVHHEEVAGAQELGELDDATVAHARAARIDAQEPRLAAAPDAGGGDHAATPTRLPDGAARSSSMRP